MAPGGGLPELHAPAEAGAGAMGVAPCGLALRPPDQAYCGRRGEVGEEADGVAL